VYILRREERKSLIPTKRSWFFFALGVPVGVVSTQAGSPYFVLAYNVLVFLAIFIDSRLAVSQKSLKFRRRYDPVLSVRVPNRVEVTIENDSGVTVIGKFRDEPPDGHSAVGNEVDLKLEPGEELNVAYHLIPPERGSSEFPGSYVRVQCPMGLSYRDVHIESNEFARVYPNVLALREFNLLNQQGRLREMGIRRSRVRGTGTEFESLREYTDGDDFRKIDHKASARRGKLIVRNFETERSQAVILVIDTGRHMLSEVEGVRKLDHVLDSLLLLTNAASVAGDMVGLLVVSDTVKRYIPPRKGRSQLGMVIEACHDLVAEPVETDMQAGIAYLGTRWKRRSLIVVFSDYEDADRARQLSSALQGLARRHIVLAVRIQDGKLDETWNKPVETADDAFSRAAAGIVLRDRRDASKVLSAFRIHQLESEPHKLATDLVSYYLSVKERGLL